MRVFHWVRDGLREARARIREQSAAAGPKGDVGGRFGFGRRAHRPDPTAHYGFDNDPNRQAKNSELP